jgi:hypothetical protein
MQKSFGRVRKSRAVEADRRAAEEKASAEALFAELEKLSKAAKINGVLAGW